jgi:6-phosphogluconolactonase (cycloisomerase 2 family)
MNRVIGGVVLSLVGIGLSSPALLAETEGRGSGGVTDPLGSQGSLTLSPDRKLLYAVNAGSGDISEFAVHSDYLELLERIPSGGSMPVALAQWGNYVYVLNAGGNGNVTQFTLSGNKLLQQVPNSTVSLTRDLSGASSISIRPDGAFLAVTERFVNNIDIFPIGAKGKLGPIVTTTSTAPGVFNAVFDQLGDLLVTETGPAGGSNASAASSYSINQDGTLAAISQSVGTLGNGNCWNAITPNGKFVYNSNSASSSISGFSINGNGALTPIGSTVVANNPAGSINLDIAISSDGRYLYSLNTGTGTVGVFAIQEDGTLKQAAQLSGLPKSRGINGIAAL